MNMNNTYKIIDDLCSTMRTIITDVEDKRRKNPGTMNIAELMNRHHLENQHSNIIAFLLNPNEKHHHPNYGNEFLTVLKEKGLGIQGETIKSVKREDSTDELRRMDLFIQTEKDYIIIENKVWADDQVEQIKDYIDFVKNNIYSEENIFVVYLTPFEKLPSEKSISQDNLNKLIAQKRYINLTYQKDILAWLERLETREDEKELQAGIIQYIDVVKGITNQRQEIFNMNQEIAKELFEKYGNLNRDQLKEKLRAVYDFQNNINLVLFMNFFEDVYKEANGKLLLLCNGKDDYKNIDDWEKDVLNFQDHFGVRFIEAETDIKKDLFIRNSNEFIFAVTKGKLTDIDYYTEEEGYESASGINSWFLNAILAIGKQATWEEDAGHQLSTHVVKYWFGIA